MKTWINAILITVFLLSVAAFTAIATMQHKRISEQSKVIEHQELVIDSLLARRMTVFDCQLHVTDKSRNIIYGRHNKGNIYQPQERKYILEIDSMNIKIK